MTFRARLLLTSMLALAVGLGAMVVIGNAVLRARADAEQTGLLRSRAQTQIAALAIREGHVAMRRTPVDRILERRAWVFDRTRVIARPSDVEPAVDRAAVALGRSAGRVVVRDTREDIALRAQPVRDHGRRIGAVVVGVPITAIERLEGYVLLGSIVIAAVLLLAGWLAIRTAVDGALRPVAAMTRDAAAWSANDLDHRFNLGPRRDELTGLAATLDDLLARIASSRRHEQRFASEVAHELRTPIARIRGRAELALRAGPDGDTKRIEALKAAVAEVDRLTDAIDALLAIARRETDPTAESVDLAAIAREAANGTALVQTQGTLPRAEGDTEVVRRALAPLLENAHRHAAGRVELVLSASGGRVRVAVRDDGPGVPAALGERVFDPGVRGDGAHDGGAGLGLALARRMARSCGGDVTLGDGPGGCFVLDLPALSGRD
jgi:signal transduction histidine kinase